MAKGNAALEVLGVLSDLLGVASSVSVEDDPLHGLPEAVNDLRDSLVAAGVAADRVESRRREIQATDLGFRDRTDFGLPQIAKANAELIRELGLFRNNDLTSLALDVAATRDILPKQAAELLVRTLRGEDQTLGIKINSPQERDAAIGELYQGLKDRNIVGAAERENRLQQGIVDRALSGFGGAPGPLTTWDATAAESKARAEKTAAAEKRIAELEAQKERLGASLLWADDAGSSQATGITLQLHKVEMDLADARRAFPATEQESPISVPTEVPPVGSAQSMSAHGGGNVLSVIRALSTSQSSQPSGAGSHLEPEQLMNAFTKRYGDSPSIPSWLNSSAVSVAAQGTSAPKVRESAVQDLEFLNNIPKPSSAWELYARSAERPPEFGRVPEVEDLTALEMPLGLNVTDDVSGAMRKSLAPTPWERVQAYYDERHTPDKDPPRELTARDRALAGLATGGVSGVAGSVLQGGMAAGPAGAIMAMVNASEGFAKMMKPVNELLQKAANVIGAVFEPFAALFEEFSDALTPTLEALRPIVSTLVELSPWFQFLKIQVEILGQVMKGVAGFLTDGVLAFLQFLKKGLSGMGISWSGLNKAISALKNPIDGLSEAFRNITANIPSDYDLLNLRVFQAGGLQGAAEEIGNLGQEAIDALVAALTSVSEMAGKVVHWLEKLVNKIEKWIDNMNPGGGGGGGYNPIDQTFGEGTTDSLGLPASSGESSGSSSNSGVVVYGDIHLNGVRDPEDMFRKLERVRERHDVIRGGAPGFRTARRHS